MFKNNQKIVGLEITRKVIKAAEVSGYLSNNPKLLRYAEIVLPDQLTSNSEVRDIEVVSDYLKDLWKEGGFTTKRVALGLSSFKMITRKHTMPLMNKKQTKDILPFELSNIVQGSNHIDNTILDFYPTSKNDENEMTGLIVSASLDDVQKIMSAIEHAGLDTEYIDFTPFSVTRSVRKFIGDKGECLIVNINPFSSELIALKNGIPERIRIVEEGASVRDLKKYKKKIFETEGKSLEEESALQEKENQQNIEEERKGLRRAMREPEEVAEVTKSVLLTNPPMDEEKGFLGESHYFQVENTIDLLIGTIKKTVDYYNNIDEGEITNVYLTGEGSLSDELLNKIVPLLQIPTQKIDLDQVINIPTNKNRDELLESSIISTVGLTMRGLK